MFLKMLIQKAPDQFKDVYIYKLKDAQSLIWLRCRIKDYEIKSDNSDEVDDHHAKALTNLVIELEHQNASKDVEFNYISHLKFLID